MSNSINLIREAEKADRDTRRKQQQNNEDSNKKPPTRPKLQGFKFNSQQMQKPTLSSVISPNQIKKSENSSSGLKVDDDSDRSFKNAEMDVARQDHLMQLQKLNREMGQKSRRSLQLGNQAMGSPLLQIYHIDTTPDNVQKVERIIHSHGKAFSPGDSFSQLNFSDEKYTEDFNDAFYRNDKGQLMCENIQVSDIAQTYASSSSPFYLMSRGQINKNYQAYNTALEGIDSFIGYAVKANHNFNLLKYLAQLGCGAVLVSGTELTTAIRAGFNTQKMVYNGNGKTVPELCLAIQNGVLINIDSEFDLEHIITAAGIQRKKARTLLRINPDIDPKVHHYVSTGLASSKFGIQNSLLDTYLQKIKDNSQFVELLGVHCHIGSTITDVQLFRDATVLMIQFIHQIREKGFAIEYLNIGGGLGINYKREQQLAIPKPHDLINSIRDLLKEVNVKLIIEPGRSLVANTCILVNKVIGVKSNGQKNFIVTDGSMSELIRPSLYQTYHHIEMAEPCEGPIQVFDVVGPVCESADFLGLERTLPTPKENDCLVVFDTGAYCQAMSSVYNMKLTCAEYWVEDNKIIQIRKALSLDTYLEQFDCVGDVTVTSTNINHFQDISNRAFNQQLLDSCNQSSTKNENCAQQTTNVPQKQQNDKVLRHNSAQGSFISANIIDQIDECNEDECLSPQLNTRQLRQKIVSSEYDNLDIDNNSQSEALVKKLSSKKVNRFFDSDLQVDQKASQDNFGFYIEKLPPYHQKNEEDQYFCSESSAQDKSDSIDAEELKIQNLSKSSEASQEYDSEEEDKLFAEKQQLLMDQQNKKQIEEEDSFTSIGEDNLTFQICALRLPEPKKLSASKEKVSSPKQTSPGVQKQQFYQSPTFPIEDEKDKNVELITPIKQNPLQSLQARRQKMLQNRSVKKEEVSLIKSPVVFMSQRKQACKQISAPFEINPHNYDQFNDDEDESSYSLTQNHGGEIDYKLLTSNKKQLPEHKTPEHNDFQANKNLSLSAYKIKDGHNSSFTVERNDVQGLRKIKIITNDPTQSQVDEKSYGFENIGGVGGLGSAGVRYNNQGLSKMPQTHSQAKSQAPENGLSSNSSRRDAFRNRILQQKGPGSLGGFGAFNRFRGGGPDSSVSSRHVIRLTGNETDADIQSQQEDEYKNVFEKLYTEMEDLGEGCSSVVKKCEHKTLKVIRAVKIIRNDNPEYIFQAKNEYELLKDLNNNQIVKAYDCIHDESKGTLYIVMEYVEGDTLEDHVLKYLSDNKQNPFLKESFIQKIFKQLITLVDYIHEKGICHRDLKPDNILINLKTHQIKLMDFNVSKRFQDTQNMDESNKKMSDKKLVNFDDDIKEICLDNQQQANGPDSNNKAKKTLQSMGSFKLQNFVIGSKQQEVKKYAMRTMTGLDQWSAPETRQGGEYTQAIDLWGIGVMLYYAVAGQPPFQSHDEDILRDIIQNCKYQPFSEACKDNYSKECIDIIKHLIVADPEKRYTLQNLLDSEWYNKDFTSDPTSPIVGSPNGEASPQKEFNTSSYISPRKEQMNFKNPIISGLAAQNNGNLMLSASPKINKLSGVRNSKPRKISDNEFLDNRKESQEFFLLQNGDLKESDRNESEQNIMKPMRRQESDNPLIKARLALQPQESVNSIAAALNAKKKERDPAIVRQKDTRRDSNDNFKNRKPSFFVNSPSKPDLIEAQIIEQVKSRSSLIIPNPIKANTPSQGVLTPMNCQLRDGFSSAVFMQGASKEASKINKNYSFSNLTQSPGKGDIAKENQILSTFLSSQPFESEQAEGDFGTPKSNKLIKLLKVNPVQGGYSSDDESDSDGIINVKQQQSFLGNKNVNYSKYKNSIHITSRYQLGIDKNRKLKKKFSAKRSSEQDKNIKDDSGYDEGEESVSNHRINSQSTLNLGMRKMKTQTSPLKQPKSKKNKFGKKAMDLIKQTTPTPKKSQRNEDENPFNQGSSDEEQRREFENDKAFEQILKEKEMDELLLMDKIKEQ